MGITLADARRMGAALHPEVVESILRSAESARHEDVRYRS